MWTWIFVQLRDEVWIIRHRCSWFSKTFSFLFAELNEISLLRVIYGCLTPIRHRLGEVELRSIAKRSSLLGIRTSTSCAFESLVVTIGSILIIGVLWASISMLIYSGFGLLKRSSFGKIWILKIHKLSYNLYGFFW